MCGLCLADGMWILYPCAGVKELVPNFLGSGMEVLLLGAAVRGPCRDTGSALWGTEAAQAMQKPLLAVPGSQILGGSDQQGKYRAEKRMFS